MLKSLCICLGFVVVQAAAQQGPVEQISRLKKAVVTDFYFGFHNNVGRPLTIELIKEIGDEEGFTVEVIDDEASFKADRLKDAQVLVLQNMSAPNLLSPTSKSVIIDFVENGGGLFSLHSTLDMMGGGLWPWLDSNVTYALFTGGHVGGDPADVYIDSGAYDADSNLHPILQGLDSLGNVDMNTGLISDWVGKWFWWENHFRDRENVTILLRLDTESYPCDCPALDGDQPALWITDRVGGPDGGSTSHFLVGGSDRMFAIAGEKGIKLIWKNVMQYLAGYEVREVSAGTVKSKNQARVSVNTGTRSISVFSHGIHTVRITSVSGETVYHRTGNNHQDHELSGIREAGIYVVRVSSGGRKILRRFVYPGF